MQKVARVKEARKRRGKGQEKGLKRATAKKLPLPVNMENARQFGKFGFSFIVSKRPFCMVSYFQKYIFSEFTFL